MFSTQSQSLLRRGKGRLSSISHLVPKAESKIRRSMKRASSGRMSSVWETMRPLRSRRAMGWIGGGLAILSAASYGYSMYSKRKRNSQDLEW